MLADVRVYQCAIGVVLAQFGEMPEFEGTLTLRVRSAWHTSQQSRAGKDWGDTATLLFLLALP